MSQIRNNGGPAFPLTRESSPMKNYGGMSLRDWFAGQALASMGTWAPPDENGFYPSDIHGAKARWAYKMADAMIAAREAQS